MRTVVKRAFSFLASALAVGVITSNITAFAETSSTNRIDLDDAYYGYLFQQTGVTLYKLHEIETEQNVDLYDYFGVEEPSQQKLEAWSTTPEGIEYSTGVSSNDGVSARSTTTIDFSYSMPITQWQSLCNIADASDVLVTRDCTTLSIPHGHAALVYDSTMTVEHMGPTLLGIPGSIGKSVYTGISNVWSHCKSCRLYESPDARSEGVELDIAEYARGNLTGWSYNLLANKNSTSEVNCATLVWKAYYWGGGITMNGVSGTNTIIPADFVERNDLTMLFTVGWGHVNPHTWA